MSTAVLHGKVSLFLEQYIFKEKSSIFSFDLP